MINVSELEEADLDRAVARLCHVGGRVIGDGPFNGKMSYAFYKDGGDVRWSPSTDWGLAGGIIQSWRIEIIPDRPLGPDAEWSARVDGHDLMRGSTALIAAMRAFVQSRVDELGNSI